MYVEQTLNSLHTRKVSTERDSMGLAASERERERANERVRELPNAGDNFTWTWAGLASMSKFANSLFKLRSPGRINMNMAETNYPVGHGPNGHTMVCVGKNIYGMLFIGFG